MINIKTKAAIYSLVFLSVACAFLMVARIIRDIRLNRMVGQMIMVGFRGTSQDDQSVKDIADDIYDGRIGGVILFSVDVEKGMAPGGQDWRKETKSRNIIDTTQVGRLIGFLQRAARDGGNPPLFVSIDQESGAVVRLGAEHGFGAKLPSAKEMSGMTYARIRKLYSETGAGLAALGFNIDFAPCVDVDINPQSPAIGAHGRSFSKDPRKVSEYGRAAADGLRDAGIIFSFKHFPGHGSAGSDTHDGMADITKTWKKYELEPYKNVGAAGMVMVAHVVHSGYDSLPASISPVWIKKVLREDLKFEGVVISDDLQMGALYNKYDLPAILKMAVLAGNDIMLLGNNLRYMENLGRVAHAEIVRMVKNGEIPRARIKESFDRIIELKKLIK